MASQKEQWPNPSAGSSNEALNLLTLLSSGVLKQQIQCGALDDAIEALEKRRKQLSWARLPKRIILLRHGESEGNVDHSIYSVKGDSLLELTPNGMQQAKQAGARLRDLVGNDRIFVAVSPFERTQQTLYGLYLGGFPRQQVGVVHHDPRIREQEFGNFQNPGLTATVRAEEKMVGRFYYRRPNAESSADVFDRVSAFWEALLSESNGNSLLMGRRDRYDSCLLVTHGLTIRLLLMAIFQWSVGTFETVFNLNNCEHITLRKNPESLCYEICPSESYPPRFPWATRPVWVRLKSLSPKPETAEKLRSLKAFRDSGEGKRLGQLLRPASNEKKICLARTPSRVESAEEGGGWAEVDRTIDELERQEMLECSLPFTVLDFLTLKPPRTMQFHEAVRRLVKGHQLRGTPEEQYAMIGQSGVALEDVVSIDWWGSTVSHRGKMLHMLMDKVDLTALDLDVTAGGRSSCLSPVLDSVKE